NPFASPLAAESLEGLPPALFVLAEFDIIRDQAIQYAERLRSAHVQVEVKTYAGQLHGFAGFGGVAKTAREALADAGRAVRAALGDDVGFGSDASMRFSGEGTERFAPSNSVTPRNLAGSDGQDG
ncbi:MAG TPA: alpha/beta hydrolase fold domain-containing protein, partial [Candidatus Acidoferrales bacterium]|nr:alpha/beta hydrolase fold domain-containing protein [Candidatus Acidoferrales bacterium]